MPDTECDDAAPPPEKPCPICGKPSVFAARPFCSKRCADIDLHRWLTGGYTIAHTSAASPGKESGDPDNPAAETP